MGRSDNGGISSGRGRRGLDGNLLLIALLILAVAAVGLVLVKAAREAMLHLHPAVYPTAPFPGSPSPAPPPLPRPGGAPLGRIAGV